LRNAGKLLVNGPITDGGDLRGVSIYDSRDAAEVRRWVEADPAITDRPPGMIRFLPNP
jgi:uncharacterized protein YciI